MGDEEENQSSIMKCEIVLRDLESLLREKFGVNLIVDYFTTTSLVSAGQSYGSTMLRVDSVIRRNGPKFETEKLSFAAKLVPPSEYQRKIFDTPFSFRKEIYMFTDIVPAFRAIELESGIQESELFDPLPELYGSRFSLETELPEKFDDDAVILMENLEVKNYSCGNRKFGIDLAHAKLLVEKLARFHALGIAVKLKKPKLFEEFKSRCKCRDSSAERKITGNYVLEAAKKVPELLPHLARIEKAIIRFTADSSSPEVPAEPWGTIVHADLSVNNVMFSDDEGGYPKGIKFIDFQLYAYQNPLRDLIFFLSTSLRAEVCDADSKNLIDLYYEEFISNIAMLNCDVNLFSRDSFNEQFADAVNLEYHHCAFMIRIIRMDFINEFGKIPDPENFFEKEPALEYLEQLTKFTRKFIENDWI